MTVTIPTRSLSGYNDSIEREDAFTAVVFDHRTTTWRKLKEYNKEEFSIQEVLPEAVSDRAAWFAETGRLDEL